MNSGDTDFYIVDRDILKSDLGREDRSLTSSWALTTRLALEPTQSSLYRLPMALSLRVKPLKSKLTLHFNLMPGSKMPS
jgi:hypothetical protein